MDGTQWFRAAAITFFLGVGLTLFWSDAPMVLALWLKLGLNVLVGHTAIDWDYFSLAAEPPNRRWRARTRRSRRLPSQTNDVG
jgi:hypothetical protein